jgi:RimJ/RimL family protein N-acetyltransferase
MLQTIPARRLRLRTPVAADLPSYLAYRNAPDLASRISKEEGRSFLLTQEQMPDDAPGWRMFSVERLDRAGLIGEVGVFIKTENLQQGDIGWWLHADHRGQGYALEAAQVLVDWCFSKRGLHRVTANCLSSNAASIAVMGRLGMRFEGRSIESCLKDGVWQDESRYALLHREWSTRQLQTTY